MSTYQPGIPTGLVNLDVDYKNIQDNFQQLDTSFGVDHVTFSSKTAQNGYHTSIHLNPVSTTTTNPPKNFPPVAPVAVPGYGQLFSAEVNDGISADTALYWLTGNNLLTQLTSNFVPVATQNGRTFLPGGIILQWAQFSPLAVSGTRNFATSGIAFPNNCFIVILQGDDSTVAQDNLLVTARSKLSFSFSSLNAGKKYTYLAIGN